MGLTARGVAQQSLGLFTFALLWMKDPLLIGGLPAFPADLLFVIAAGSWVLSLLRQPSKLRWSNGFWPLLLYFAALAFSTMFAADQRTSSFKLATEAYLMAIPLLVYSLVDSWNELRRLFLYYVTGAAFVGVLGTMTVLLFPLFGHAPLAGTLHHYGTLQPGPYPRLEVTFEYPAMMANYLALAMMLVILSERCGWLSGRVAVLLGAAMGITALFALTPGFGGVLVMLGVYFWSRRRGTPFGRCLVVGSLAAGLLQVLVAAVTPILHRTAPFLIYVPGLEKPLAPAVRLLAWMDALRTFVSHPLTAAGSASIRCTCPTSIQPASSRSSRMRTT